MIALQDVIDAYPTVQTITERVILEIIVSVKRELIIFILSPNNLARLRG